MKARWLFTSICAWVILWIAVAASAQPRRLFPDGSNVSYGDEGDRNRVVDVFLPVGVEPPYPVVLMFHGSPGDKSDHVRSGIPQLIVDEGYVAIAVRYYTELPDAYADALCALAWTYTQGAADWGFDPERVAVFGSSYGGLVSAWLAAIDEPARFMPDCPYALPEDARLSGVAANAGAFQAHSEYVIQAFENAPDEIPDVAPAEVLTIAATLRETPINEWRALELPDAVRTQLEMLPFYLVDGSEPPHLLIHGAGDSFVPYEESYEYAGILIRQRVSVELVLDRLAGHVVAPYLFDKELATFLHRIFA